MKRGDGEMKKKGLTLVEIMITVGIVGLLFTIPTIGVLKRIERGRDISTQAELTSIYTAITNFQITNGKYPKSWDELKEDIDISKIKNKYELNDEVSD